QPGNYQVEFNAANFSSGVYFYHLQVGSFNETKKLILVR
ncbi:MAG: T9SS type A sorting domain-containing protein, partial [Nanoarchaeota archaeon]|nr:T9SS type A sorting domain-containing protein [Nanoarchaeota archaeon]